MADEARDVLAANQAFYDAFAAGDLAAMDRVWSQRADVACIHPGWQPLRSRVAVMGSWDAIFRGPSRVRIESADADVTFLGEAAYVICRERISAASGASMGSLVATNVFVRESGAWKMVHHHGSAVAREPEDAEPETPARGSGRTLN